MLSPYTSKFVVLVAVFAVLATFAPTHSSVRAQSAVDTPSVITAGIHQDAPIVGLVDFSDAPQVVGRNVTFAAQTAEGDNIVYTWNFGDGSSEQSTRDPNGFATHAYTSPGIYTAVVEAENGANEAFASTTVKVTLEPIIGLSAQVVSEQPTKLPNKTRFRASISNPQQDITYTWNFGDGSAFAGGQFPEHTYTATGKYVVIVTATHGDERAVVILEVEVVDAPIENLRIDVEPGPSERLVDKKITFRAVSSGTGVTYSWDFGDGVTTTGVVVEHIYSQPGNYTVSLVASNSVSTVVTTLVIIILVPGVLPIIGLTAINDTQANDPKLTNEAVSFAAFTDEGTNVTYQWFFGDGQSAIGQNVRHAYDNAGAYPVVVVATNEIGIQRATSVAYVGDNPRQLVSLGDSLNVTRCGSDTVVNGTVTGNPLCFSLEMCPDDGMENYSWEFGDGSKPKGGPCKMEHTYRQPGQYLVRVTHPDNPLNQQRAVVIVLHSAYLPTLKPPSPRRGPQILAPDLVVDRVNIFEDTMEIYIKNIGTSTVAPGAAFWVDAYVNPKRDNLPIKYNMPWQSVAEQGLVWGVKLPGGLGANETIKLVVNGPYYAANLSNFKGGLDSSVPLYVQVDSVSSATSYGGVEELHEKSSTFPFNNVWCRDPNGCVLSTGPQ